MNATDCVPLVDTTRDEFRQRIDDAVGRFDRVARAADPDAHPPGHGWTVQQIVAHVLTIAHRYRNGAQGRPYKMVDSTAAIAGLNQAELEAAMAPLPDLAGQLQAVATELAAACDAFTNDTVIPFHTFASVSGTAWQSYWLGELLMHGEDIARAMKSRWEFRERDNLLVIRGLMEIGHAYLRADVSPDTDVSVAFELPAARPYVVNIHDGIAEYRDLRPSDRPDAVMRGPASTLAQVFYGRIGTFTAARRGLFVVGGRRPWKALKLMSYFERP
jgi:uncharacterized protein (TIGR03083 family)